MKKILLIEDDPDIITLLTHYLSTENFKISVASDGITGLKLARKEQPQLVILDLMLPGMTGLEICKEIRRDSATTQIPILMLTAKGDEADKIIGLELGADDYMSKPFSPRELVARVKALMRRGNYREETEAQLRYGDLTLDTAKHEVTVTDRIVELTAKEFGLLKTLLHTPGKVFSREQLLDKVWGEDYYGGPRTVDVHIRKLREKIPLLTDAIITVKSHGYKLREK